MKPPKQWTSNRVCPMCGGRATKIYDLSSGMYKCQQCGNHYFPVEVVRRVQEKYGIS